jgi:hypothetical protein
LDLITLTHPLLLPHAPVLAPPPCCHANVDVAACRGFARTSDPPHLTRVVTATAALPRAA